MVEEDNNQSETLPVKDKWSNIISVIGSPLKMFGLIILVCSTVFSISAGISDNENNFKYTIHMFLGIVGGFLLLALWCPKLLYHPNELCELKKQDKEFAKDMVDRPGIPTVLIIFGAIGYICYQKFL